MFLRRRTGSHLATGESNPLVILAGRRIYVVAGSLRNLKRPKQRLRAELEHRNWLG